MSQPVISDGSLVTANSYDNVIYCFGRGSTATTVTAPMTSIRAGDAVVIQGTVTDQSPGLQGTPAISDQYMTPWMQYMYMDYSMPTNAQGVPVSIDAIDPNGNFVHLGNTTSDSAGTFCYAWTPSDIPGTYNIVASFAGSNSYYSSSGETHAIVVSPPATIAAPTPTPTSVADMYFVPAIAGVIVAIIIGFVVLALLMLRKHP
jgi:hypothetical protein